MKKIVLPGLAIGLVMLLISIILGYLIGLIAPSIMTEYQDPAIFRPWSDPLMWLMYLQPFVLGMILAWLWDRSKILFKRCNLKGFHFGLVYWVLTLPGMIMSYGSFVISFTMVAAWTLTILIQAITAGFILERMNKQEAENSNKIRTKKKK